MICYIILVSTDIMDQYKSSTVIKDVYAISDRPEGFLIDLRCSCGCCCEESLESALEFRCCREIGQAVGKLMFDGSIERISCYTT